MNKYQSLMSKVELFYKLAVYGSRQAFLAKISEDENLNYIINARNSVAKLIACLWAKKPDEFPDDTKSTYEFLAYSEITSETGPEQLKAIVGSARMIRNKLAASNNKEVQSFVIKDLDKAVENLAAQVNKFLTSDASIPAPEPESTKPASTTAPTAKSQNQYQLFQSLYNKIKRGQEPTEQEKADWTTIANNFMGRLNQLNNLIANPPAGQENKVPQWKAELNAIKQVHAHMAILTSPAV